ncbi:MAG TPA: hypothetical protein VHZ09_01910 [Acidobacteriaceae bacterium]|nr:hypothetical protein [Acidobacteriaceae bacterium]
MLLSCALTPTVGRAQEKNPDKTQAADVQHSSGPLAWVSSDVNPKTVFWIQGRFVQVDDATSQGDAEVATILCSVRDYECLEIDGEIPFAHEEQVWIEDFKPVSWDSSGILATTRSLDGCTDETLKIRFSPVSVVVINSPVLPMSERCKKINQAWDKLSGYPAHGAAKGGSAIAAQTEEDELVPTRGLFPSQDADSDFGKAPTPAAQKNP